METLGNKVDQRRNTRSSSTTSDKIKESESANGTTDGSCDVKRRSQNKTVRGENGEVVSFTSDAGVTYTVGESAYLESERSDNPYLICTIQEIKVNKRETAFVAVKTFYRTTDVPDSVYQLLLKDRIGENESENKSKFTKEYTNRELFISDIDTPETYSITQLRGKCNVTHIGCIEEVSNLELKDDVFFCILSFNPDTRRLASVQGETKIGPSHQWTAAMRGYFQKAVIPEYLSNVNGESGTDREFEEMTWAPNVNDAELITCLRSARNMAAVAEMYDGVSPEEGCMVASRDDTTINTLRVLFKNEGNARKAIEELMKNPIPVTIDSKWTEEEMKRFQKGLKIYGKDFFKIRKELLSHKSTKDLVEFYYLWKKRPNGLFIRPQKQKRLTPLKKGSKGTSDKPVCDDNEENKESETNPICTHCSATQCDSWMIGGKDGVRLCTDCDILFKKYGDCTSVLDLQNEIMQIDSKNGLEKGFLSSLANNICAPQQSVFVYTALKDKKSCEPKHNKTSTSTADDTTNDSNSKKKSNKRLWDDINNENTDGEPSCSGLKRHKVEKEFNKTTEQKQEPHEDKHNEKSPFVKHEYTPPAPAVVSAVVTQSETTTPAFSVNKMIKDENQVLPDVNRNNYSALSQLSSEEVKVSNSQELSEEINPITSSMQQQNNTKPMHLLTTAAIRTTSHQKYAIASACPKYGVPSSSHLAGQMFMGAGGPLQVGTVYSVHPNTTLMSGSTQFTTGTFYPAAPTSEATTITTDSGSSVALSVVKSPVKQMHLRKEKLLAAQQLMDTNADIIPTDPNKQPTGESPIKSVNPRKDKLLAHQPHLETNEGIHHSPVPSTSQMYRYPQIPGFPPHMIMPSVYAPHMQESLRYQLAMPPNSNQLSPTMVTMVATSSVSSVPTISQMKPDNVEEKQPQQNMRPSTSAVPHDSNTDKDSHHIDTTQNKPPADFHHYRGHGDSISKSQSTPRRLSEEHVSKLIKTEKGIVQSDSNMNPYAMPAKVMSPRTSSNPQLVSHGIPYMKTEPGQHTEPQHSDYKNNFPFNAYANEKMFERYPAPYKSPHVKQHNIKQEVPGSYSMSEQQMLHPGSRPRSARTSPHPTSGVKERPRHGSSPVPPSHMHRSASFTSQPRPPHALHASPSSRSVPPTRNNDPTTSHGQRTHEKFVNNPEIQIIQSPPPAKCKVVYVAPTRKQSSFLRTWDRRENSCSRTDLVHIPRQSSSANKQPPSRPAHAPHTPQQAPVHQSQQQSSHNNEVERKRERSQENPERRRESLHPPAIPRSTPQRSTPIHSIPRSTPAKTPNTSLYEHKVPSAMISPYMIPDATASRTLQQYASYNDVQRTEALNAIMARNPFYQLYSAERERELRELESRERLSKHGMDVKPPEAMNPRQPHIIPGAPGLHNIPVSGIPTTIPELNSLHFDPLRPPFPAGVIGGFGPGVPSSLATAMGGFVPGSSTPGFPLLPARPGMDLNFNVMDRFMTNDPLQAERLAAEHRYQMELLHHHQHSHVHSHLHLHQQSQMPGGPHHPGAAHAGPILPPPHALNMSDPLLNPLLTASALEQYAAANPLLAAAMRNPATALMHHPHAAAMNLHAIAGREQTPHPLSASQQLQAVHEQHLLEHTQRGRAVFDPMARFAVHKP